MPVHDWRRVDAGTFHAFHTGWITHLSEALNAGLLPRGYYAMPEQHGGRLIADVLTLQTPSPSDPPPMPEEGGVAVADAPPQVRLRLTPTSAGRATRRTLTIRHVSGHRVIALIEIVSPANKDRAAHVAELVDKAEAALCHGVHLLLVDLLLPGPHDPQGLHAAIWARFDDEPYLPPASEPLTLAAYAAGPAPEAYVEHLPIGAPLAEMPLFLTPDRYVNTPLDQTYTLAFRGMPAVWRDVLNGYAPIV